MQRSPGQDADERPPTPVQTVAEQVVQAIRDGRLAPGQRMVETEYARRLGVARTTVREAFQRLEAQGLLTLERNRGFLVRRLTPHELREIYQLREALDGLTARMAATSFAADSAELDEIMEGLRKARDQFNMREFTRLNEAFHHLIRRRAGNALVARVLSSAEQSVYHYQFRLLVDAQHVFATHESHEEIYRALKAGDASAAEEAARRHVRESLTELLSLPEALFSGS